MSGGGEGEAQVRLSLSRPGHAVSVTNSFGGAVWDLAVSPDGRTLVAACEDGTLRVFDVTSDGLAYVRAVASCEARVLCCSFHPSKPLVALGDARGRMEVWDLATGAQLCRVKGPSRCEQRLRRVSFFVGQ